MAKTRIMLADSSSELAKSQSALMAMSIVFKEKGLSGLFSGILPRVAWISVGGALFLGIYDLSVSKFKQTIGWHYFDKIFQSEPENLK